MNSPTKNFILITIIIGLATACNSNISNQYKSEKNNDTVSTNTKPPYAHNANEQEQTFETYEKVFFEYDSVKYKDIATTVINPHNIFYVSDLDQNFEIKEKQNFDVEPLGYRGRNYQRFYIHFDTVYKSSAITHANTYLAQGRTRYRDTIRTFEGIITLDSASTAYYTNLSRTYGVSFVSLYGHYSFLEDSITPGSGLIQGNVHYYCIIKDGQLYYDSEGIDHSDGFKNRQYTGQWIAYDNNFIEPCNWGDFRIPNSRGLDIGAGEFVPRDEYANNGWQLLTKMAYDYSHAVYDEYVEDNKWWKE